MADLTVKELVSLAYQAAKSRGFHSAENNIWKMLGNIHGEVSEAWEEARKPDFDPAKTYFSKGYVDGIDKPEGLPAELADIVIRVADTAGALGIDLERAILDKMEFNETRPFRHGNKRA